ncbi:MAG TPA: CPBP family intramembrane metalloprotease, partial [Phnomibacter sp.]|nr:CPBP family intramembrane metalloprotease [Phnomibacter sp.]
NILLCAALMIGLTYVLQKLTGLYAGLIANESGTPVNIGNNAMASIVVNSLAAIIAVLVCFAFLNHQPLRQLGLHTLQWQLQVYAGICAAGLVLCGGTLCASVAGIIKFEGLQFMPGKLLLWLLVIALGAASEEFFFRGVVLQNLLPALPSWLAVLISALLFVLAHSFNNGFSAMGAANILIAGLLLGYGYLYMGGLWFGIAFHVAWNFIQGPLLGFAVSGVPIPSLLQQQATNTDAFGFEGSLIALLLQLALLIFMVQHFGGLRPPTKTVIHTAQVSA